MVDDTTLFRLGAAVTVVFLALTSVSVYAMIAFGFGFDAWLWLVIGGTVLGLLLVGASVVVATVRKLARGLLTSEP